MKNLFSNIQTIFNIAALILSSIVILVTVILPRNRTTSDDSSIQDLYNQIEVLEYDVNALNHEMEILDIQSSTSSDIVMLQKIALVDERLTRIESIILDDPEKALEVTLLKKELDNIKVSIDALREEVVRTFGLYQFLLGTIALAILGLLIGNIPRGKKIQVDRQK